MHNAVFVAAFAVVLGLAIHWSFKNLPGEGRQFIGSIPIAKTGPDQWTGLNLTYYGLIISASLVTSTALIFVLMGSTKVSAGLTSIVLLLMLPICAPAARILARVVEKKPHTLTIGGAAFVGIFAAPVAVWIANAVAGQRFGTAIPMLPCLAAIAIAYAIGEGIGRLACISFGCCYGKPLSQCDPLMRRLIGGHAFVFSGKTKKIAYESCLDEKEVVPIQAITCVTYVATGLAAVFLFLHSAFLSALFLCMVITQGWRVFSETLRADYRGEGKISAYQIMAGVAVVYTLAFGSLMDSGPVAAPDIRRGLAAMWNPAMILALQAVGIGTFLYTGRSKVTGSILSFHVLKGRI